MQVRTTRSRLAGRSARFELGGSGSLSAIFMHSAGAFSPANAGSPVSISYKIAPSAQTSVRSSTSFVERICSGDMYPGEPMMAAVRVIAAPSILEIPKSSSLTHGVPSERVTTYTFDGFRSR